MGFSLKKLKKLAKKVTAPIRIGIEAPLKAVTHVAAQTGWKPAVKANSAMAKQYRETLADSKEQWKIGAAVGGAMLTKQLASKAFPQTVAGDPRATTSTPAQSTVAGDPLATTSTPAQSTVAGDPLATVTTGFLGSAGGPAAPSWSAPTFGGSSSSAQAPSNYVERPASSAPWLLIGGGAVIALGLAVALGGRHA